MLETTTIVSTQDGPQIMRGWRKPGFCQSGECVEVEAVGGDLDLNGNAEQFHIPRRPSAEEAMQEFAGRILERGGVSLS